MQHGVCNMCIVLLPLSLGNVIKCDCIIIIMGLPPRGPLFSLSCHCMWQANVKWISSSGRRHCMWSPGTDTPCQCVGDSAGGGGACHVEWQPKFGVINHAIWQRAFGLMRSPSLSHSLTLSSSLSLSFSLCRRLS